MRAFSFASTTAVFLVTGLMLGGCAEGSGGKLAGGSANILQNTFAGQEGYEGSNMQKLSQGLSALSGEAGSLQDPASFQALLTDKLKAEFGNALNVNGMSVDDLQEMVLGSLTGKNQAFGDALKTNFSGQLRTALEQVIANAVPGVDPAVFAETVTSMLSGLGTTS